MGLIRAAYKAGKAAAKGASGTDIVKEGAKGLLPRGMGGVVDRVAAPTNMGRVKQGINNVIDSGRAATFNANIGGAPKPLSTPTSSSGSSTGAPPKPPTWR